ncbi:MAG: hypothetical protein AB1657_02320 [Candidatus Micrarchaeota archaeon]
MNMRALGEIGNGKFPNMLKGRDARVSAHYAGERGCRRGCVRRAGIMMLIAAKKDGCTAFAVRNAARYGVTAQEADALLNPFKIEALPRPEAGV